MEDVKKGKTLNIAYSGVEGAFANIAAKNIFPDMNMVACSDFSEAYESVVNDTCDFAVLPIENSYAGEVGHVMDLMFSGNLNVVGIYYLRVTHNLLAIKGAKIEDIKTVISHPQALEQCRGYIKAHGFEKIQEKNTAFSAKQVSEKGDKSLAAIASVETAKLYDLEVLAHEINESNDNTTRFAVLSKKKIAYFTDEGVYIGSTTQDKDAMSKHAQKILDTENPGHHHSGNNMFILMFTVKHEAGALAKAIAAIGDEGFNMKALRSRPLKGLAWQYYFYVEAEGTPDDNRGKSMLKELSKHCLMYKVLGTYRAD
ncbi:MAG TPA: bifunctional chorismate mutase/prephenate dehydratase [Lachnospiraceae bacterium]|nr:bifunctional chorismate mutase/prephenate dehydratase [Lachnospiraceae bacterium]